MATKVAKTVKVLIDEDKPFPAELIADEIKAVADGFRAVSRSKLTEEAVVVLLHEATKVGRPAIRAILTAAQHLDTRYLK